MASAPPPDGAIYSFRTRPFSEFAPKDTGRYSALKVLGSSRDLVVVAVLDWIGASPPSLEEVKVSATLREHSFAHTGGPAIWGVPAEWWDVSELDSVALLGTVPLSAEEVRIASRILDPRAGKTIAPMQGAAVVAEGEWRWANDRVALVAEQERVIARVEAHIAAMNERREARLRALTWDQLLGEQQFESWSPSPPYPPESFTREARETIHNACRDLRALGPEPREADVRRLLRKCVEWFNLANKQAGGVIETGEREDIHEVLEEMACVAGRRSLADEIEGWRTW